jgi:hypothetical protein
MEDMIGENLFIDFWFWILAYLDTIMGTSKNLLITLGLRILTKRKGIDLFDP